MFFSKLACAAAITSIAYAAPQSKRADSLTLLAANVQKGSTVDGSKQIGAAEVGQALSATSDNNFINFCSGKTLTDGLQNVKGSCNGIPMGDIPAKTSMISAVIINPPTGGKGIASDTTFDIQVQMLNLEAGAFTNADATYYAAPQALKNGKVVGHTHVTVQDMGNSMNPTKPLDPTKFAFFKGINDAGDGNGLLSATVTGGLPAGNYRVCTLTSSANHQPVLMPVAQRGTADDCTKFVVTGNGKTENAAANDGSGGLAAASKAQAAVDAGAAAVDTAAAKATDTAAAKGGKANAKATTSAADSKATDAAAAKGGKANAKATSTSAADTKATTAAKAGKGDTKATSASDDAKATSAAKNNKGGNAKADATTTSTSAKETANAKDEKNNAKAQDQAQGQGQNRGGRGKARREFIV